MDDRGEALVLPNGKVPKRIVSLLPSLAETICALGECQRLVGTDRYTNWPDAVKPLPKVGGGIDPNIEAIVALRPDVVVASVKSRGLERLASLGIPVVALEPKTHADVQKVMFKLAYLLRLPDPQADAAKVWQQIDQGVTEATSSLPPPAAGTTVYFEVNRAPYAAGESSFIGETLTRLGARNVVPTALGPFPKLNPEFVVRADPDIIMVGRRNFDGMTARPGWQRMRAVKQGRICVLPDAMSDTVVRPGPRMAEGAEALADCIRRFAPALVPASAVESQR
ncbi:helical backbone metal receptor [Hydrogenophaga sp. 5NK40-0174]|uniref:ABC transporter substrate-binding protein n=1 Tax=Hydrogenophaga sp. 5NK40-0174 TaxID=3127649 RepID=UPI0033403CA2